MNICTASNHDDWKVAVEKFKPHGINLFATDRSVVELWKIKEWPTFIIVNEGGQITCRNASNPEEVPLVDYLILSTVKGKNIVEAAWEYHKYYENKKGGVQKADNEKGPFDKWIAEVSETLANYNKWRYEYRKKIGRPIPKDF